MQTILESLIFLLNHAEKFLKKHTFIDYVIHGEGEKVFLDLVESFENKNTKEVEHVCNMPNLSR